MAAVTMMAMLVLLATVVDVSLLMVVRGNLQTGLDAAALAAVQPSGGVLQLDTRRRTEEVTERVFFSVGDSLPDPPERVRRRESVYRTVCTEQVDPVTGQITRECHDKLRGWWVTYVTAYREAVQTEMWLNPGRARLAAQDVLLRNARAWQRTSGLQLADLELTSDALTCEPADHPERRSDTWCEPGFDAYVIRYRIGEGHVRVKTLLAGFLIGNQGWVNISLSGIESSLSVGKRR